MEWTAYSPFCIALATATASLLGWELLARAPQAWAGVPYLTDDPDTPDAGHYEINLAAQYTHRQGDTSGQVFGVDVNYGWTTHTQLTVNVPLAFDHTPDAGTSVGLGDVEFEVKYRFIDQDDWGWRPAVAVAPQIATPTGNVHRGLGTGRAHPFLPLWVSKEIYQWTVFTGAGYEINPGSGNVNWWFGGFAATYEFTPELTLGGEIFHNSRQESGGKSSTGFNLGTVYNLTDVHHLLFSVGRNLRNASANNQFSTFVGWQLTF
jgi:hypothetical protein